MPILPIQFEEREYQIIRKLAFENHVSMAEVVRNILKKKFKEALK